MKKMFLTVLIGVLASTGSANELTSSNDIVLATEKALAMVAKYGKRRVLFVSDLDNTLLKTRQDLASEPWFNWQAELLKDTKSEQRIACDMNDLLNLYYVSISLSLSDPVQENQDVEISKMQAGGVRTMALTARGFGLASSTFRELLKNKLEFAKLSPGGGGFTETHVPWTVRSPEASGLTANEISEWKLVDGRPVLFQGGVLFADGQHKGALLRTLIHKLGLGIDGVVFWDNDEKNTKRMYDAFKDTKIEVVSIRASRQDAEIKKFVESDKSKVTQDYLNLRKLLDQTYLYPRPCQLPIDLKI